MKIKKVVSLLRKIVLIGCFLPVLNSYAASIDVFNVSAVQEEIVAGDIALFNLILTLNPEQESTTDYELIVDLPESKGQLLNTDNELQIDGVTPTKEGHQLIYHFKKGTPIGSYKIVLKWRTENGAYKENEKINVRGTLKKEASLVAESTDELTVNSSFSMNILTALEEHLNPRETQATPWAGDEIILKVSANVPFKNKGMSFIKPSSPIMIEYTLDENIEFLQPEPGTPAPKVIEHNKIIWEFAAPSIEEQVKATENVWSQELYFRVKFKDNAPAFKKLVSSVQGKAETLTNQPVVTAPSQFTIMLSTDGSTYPEYSGYGILGLYNWGPEDGKGKIHKGGRSKDPSVYSNATLGFGMRPTVGHAYTENASKSFQFYKVRFDVDPHLDVTSVFLGKNFFLVSGETEILPAFFNPIVNLDILYEGETTPVRALTHLNPNIYYSALEMNIDTSKTIKSLLFDFEFAPSGLFITDGILYYTKIKDSYKDYIGEVKSEMTVELSGENRGEDIVHYTYSKNGAYNHLKGAYIDNPSWANGAASRNAHIVEEPQFDRKILMTEIDIENQKENIVSVPNQEVSVSLKNDASSFESFKGPFTSYILLPEGVHYDDQQPFIEKVTDNYQGLSQEMLKLTWSEQEMQPNSSRQEKFHVNIIEQEAKSNLLFELYTFSEDDEIIAPKTNQPIMTDTTKLKDESDINSNGDTDEMVFVSGKQYSFVKSGKVKPSVAFKNWKEPLTDELAINFNHLKQPVTQVYYFDNVTDSHFDQLTLIGQIPNLNSYDLVRNIAMSNEFSTTLTGEIVLPKEWQDKVDVTYCEDEYPALANLIDKHTVYPSGISQIENHAHAQAGTWKSADSIQDFSKVTHFKIEKKEEIETISGRGIKVSVPLAMPLYFPKKDVEACLTSGNFLVGVNDLYPARSNIGKLKIERQLPVPPLNPLEPIINQPVQPIDPTPLPSVDKSELAINYASHFDFGTHESSKEAKVYNALGQKLKNKAGLFPYYAQVTDARSMESHAGTGWKLTLTQRGLMRFGTKNKHYLLGSKIRFKNGEIIPEKDNQYDKPSVVESAFEFMPLTPTQDVTVKLVEASDGQGYGTWLYRFGSNEEAATNSISLHVPGQTSVYPGTAYQTDFIWTLSDSY